jgi:hypothetical protein
MNLRQMNNPFLQYPAIDEGFQISQDSMPNADPTTVDLMSQRVQSRELRIDYIKQHGEPFWLPVLLGLGTTPAAGTVFPSITLAQDFDLLIIGAHSDLRLSRVELKDSARNRLLTNGPVLFSAITTFTTSTYTMDRDYWFREYLLPARSQIAITVTADGTESNGNLAFLCLQPPNYNA